MARRKKVGDIYKYDFYEQYHCYCQILLGNDVCFFNYYSTAENDDVEQVIECKELFRIWTDDCFKSSKWTFICNKELSEEKKIILDKYNRPLPVLLNANDEKKMSDEGYSLYRNGIFLPCKREDCFGLELTSAWTELGITQRLRDAFFKEPLPEHVKADLPFYE